MLRSWDCLAAWLLGCLAWPKIASKPRFSDSNKNIVYFSILGVLGVLCVLQKRPLRGSPSEAPPQRLPLRGALLRGFPLRGSLLRGFPLRGSLLRGFPLRGSPSEASPQRLPLRGSPSEAPSQKLPLRGYPSQAPSQKLPLRGYPSQASSQRLPLKALSSYALH